MQIIENYCAFYAADPYYIRLAREVMHAPCAIWIRALGSMNHLIYAWCRVGLISLQGDWPLGRKFCFDKLHKSRGLTPSCVCTIWQTLNIVNRVGEPWSFVRHIVNLIWREYSLAKNSVSVFSHTNMRCCCASSISASCCHMDKVEIGGAKYKKKS